MANIIHQFTIKAQQERVFEACSTASGLDKWWTKTSSGESRYDGIFRLHFGPQFDWHARVTRYAAPSSFELQISQAHPDWDGTLVGCELTPEGARATGVLFHHTGWPEANEHWRVSCFCWAMYLRILRRYLEYGETVEYEKRLEV
jgi:uncharacterized protein YndB with AHSA1/START domain